MIERLGELRTAGEAVPEPAVTLAAWFHDAVYDGERDAEERSAVWAEEALTGVVEDAVRDEVARLVRLTETHRPDPDDAAGCALSDADLAILASEPGRYAEYVAQVRTEYGHLDDATFRAGRRAALEALASKPSLFHTAHARDAWERTAREQLDRELAGLQALDDRAAG